MSVHPLETCLTDCHAVRATGANAPETSFYAALSTLLNEVARYWSKYRLILVTHQTVAKGVKVLAARAGGRGSAAHPAAQKQGGPPVAQAPRLQSTSEVLPRLPGPRISHRKVTLTLFIYFHFGRKRGEAGRVEFPGLWFNASEAAALLTMQHLLEDLQPGLLKRYDLTVAGSAV